MKIVCISGSNGVNSLIIGEAEDVDAAIEVMCKDHPYLTEELKIVDNGILLVDPLHWTEWVRPTPSLEAANDNNASAD